MTFPLKMAQWYISHTCNLACPSCLSFNNYNIKGHEYWKDNKEYAKQWSQLVSVKDFSIIGGEPLSNPDLHNWVLGLQTLFNTDDFKICTNGTLLNKWIDQAKEWIQLNVILEISYHDPKHLEGIESALKNILSGLDIKWINGGQYNGPNFNYREYDKIGYLNDKVCVLLQENCEFRKWDLNNENDPNTSHKHCWWKNCHYWYKGELYKCGTIVGAQELSKKHNLKNKELINSYKPINIMSNNLTEQLTNLKNYIPQCSMCTTLNFDNDDRITLDPVPIKKLMVDYDHK